TTIADATQLQEALPWFCLLYLYGFSNQYQGELKMARKPTHRPLTSVTGSIAEMESTLPIFCRELGLPQIRLGTGPPANRVIRLLVRIPTRTGTKPAPCKPQAASPLTVAFCTTASWDS